MKTKNLCKILQNKLDDDELYDEMGEIIQNKEDIANEIINCFTTYQLVTSLDSRGDFKGVIEDYIADETDEIMGNSIIFYRIAKEIKDKRMFITSLFKIPYHSTIEEIQYQVKKYIK